MKKMTSILMLILLATLSFASLANAKAPVPDPTDTDPSDTATKWDVTYVLPGLDEYCAANPKAEIYVIFEADNGKTIEVFNKKNQEKLNVSAEFAKLLDGVEVPQKPLTGKYQIIDLSSGEPVVIGEVSGHVHIEVHWLFIHIVIDVEWKGDKAGDLNEETETWGSLKALYN